MKFSNPMSEALVDLGMLTCAECTVEECMKYADMEEAGEELPETIFKDNPGQYFKLSKSPELPDVQIGLQIKSLQYLHTIKNILIFFFVITLISLFIGALILFFH